MARRTGLVLLALTALLAAFSAQPSLALATSIFYPNHAGELMSPPWNGGGCIGPQCHSVGTTSTAPVEDFSVGHVDYSKTCPKCHQPGMIGQHPYHNVASNCGNGVCHPSSWGGSNLSAVPNYAATSGATFAGPSSVNASSGVLHTVHEQAGWMANVQTADYKCQPCHNMASCQACHTAPLAPRHVQHSVAMSSCVTTLGTDWSGVLDDGTNATSTANYHCGNSLCHNLSTVSNDGAQYKEERNTLADPANDMPEDTTVTATGTWGSIKSGDFTAGYGVFSNYAGSTRTVYFSGGRIQVVVEKDPFNGFADISVDGGSWTTVDTYDPLTKPQMVVYDNGTLGPGRHRVTVRVNGGKNGSARAAYVLLDQFRFYPTYSPSIDNNYPFTCPGCHTEYSLSEHTPGTTVTPHYYSTASNYSESVITSGAGCSNSGAGCHGTDSSLVGTWYADIRDLYHSSDGCYWSTCHVSPDQFKVNIPMDCVKCHAAGAFSGANVATPLAGVDSGGHYNQSLHAMLGSMYVNTTSTPANMGAGGSASARCIDCHPAISGAEGDKNPDYLFAWHQSIPTTMHATSVKSLKCAQCHNDTTLGSSTVVQGTATTCDSCHSAGSPRPTHPTVIAPVVNGTSTQGCVSASANTSSGPGCHNTFDLHTLHKNSAKGCALVGCHVYGLQASVPTMTSCGQGGQCHTTYTTFAGHDSATINGNDSTHTVASLDQTADCTGGLYTDAGGNTCDACHSANLQSAHAGYTSTLESGNTSWGVGPNFCTQCHNTSSPDNSVYVIKQTNWQATKHCSDCHNAPGDTPPGNGNGVHSTMSTVHTATVGTPGVADACGAPACHDTLNVMAIHDVVSPTSTVNDGCAATQSASVLTSDDAYGCHALNKPMFKSPVAGVGATNTAMACGKGSGGCHNKHTNTNHGEKHWYSNASDYVNTETVGSENGCINADGGCHGNDSQYVNFANPTIHFTSGSPTTYPTYASCISTSTGNPCHTSTSKTKSGGWTGGHECTNCHNGTTNSAPPAYFIGAYSRSHLASANSQGGHYDDAVHTASNMPSNTVIDQGGTASAMCKDCHYGTLRNIHENLFSPIPPYGTSDYGARISCADCHSDTYNSGLAAVLSGWGGDYDHMCEACHNVAIGSSPDPQHPLEASYSGTTPQYGCNKSGRGCHNSSDLHFLHANAPAGCFLTGSDGTCHIKTTSAASIQAVRPAKSCGYGLGACHSQYSSEATGHANNTITGSDASHTAGANQSTVATFTGYMAGLTCASCHSMYLSVEHTRTTSAHSTNPTDTCMNCHNSPNIPNSVWNPTVRKWITSQNTTQACAVCHNDLIDPAMAIHANGENATSHTVNTNNGCGNSGPGCHPTNDISSVYASYPTTQTGIHKTCLRCHDPSQTGLNKAYDPTKKGCGDSRDCHGGGNYDVTSFVHTTTVMGVINGTDATHTASAMATFTTSYVQTGTATAACSDCHTQNLAMSHANQFPGVGQACLGCHNETSPIRAAQLLKNGTGQNWNRTCQACHSVAQGGQAIHAALSTTATHTATSPLGCANSGAGCHPTANLMTLHKNRAGGCRVGGCHDASNRDNVPTMTTCGVGGQCHTTYTMSTHPGSGIIDGSDSTHTASHATTSAASMFATATADGTAIYNAGGGNTCPSCHNPNLISAHTTYTATLESGNPTWGPPGTALFCASCHNESSPDDAVTVIKTNGWSSTSCDECHGSKATGAGYGNGRHASFATSHTAAMGTPGVADGCNAASCHKTTDVLAIHNRLKPPYNLGCGASDSGNGRIGGTDDDAYTCHALNKLMLKKTIAGVGTTNTAMACGAGSGGCHTLHTNVNHGVGGAGCMKCHGTGADEDLSVMLTSSAQATSYFHHSLNGTQSANATLTGDYYAPYSVYPTDQTNGMYCISCHVDHANIPGGNRAANLRTSALSVSPAATNTDFIAGGTGGTYGVCLGCHNQTKAKNLTYQETAQDQSAYVMTISPQAYDASIHQYSVVTSFSDGSKFYANCVKCHDDNNDANSKQTGAYKLASHFTTESRLLAALGATNTGSGSISSYNLCYRCHGKTTGASAMDGYGAVLMTAPAANVRRAFSDVYAHWVTSATAQGRHDAAEFTSAPAQVTTLTTNGWWGTNNAKLHVECEDCHNPHYVRANVNTPWPDAAHMRSGPPTIAINTPELSGAWGVTVAGATSSVDATGNWSGTGTFGAPKIPIYSKVASSTYEWQVCLKCHGRYAWGTQTTPTIASGSYANTQTRGVMTDVGRDFDPANYAIHPLFDEGKNQPAVTLDANWNSSAGRRLIGGASTNFGLTNTFVDGWQATSRVTCLDCHGEDTWVSTATAGPHGSSNPWLVRGLNTGIKVTFAGGSSSAINVGANAKAYCLNCHRADVYGTGSWTGAGTATYANLSRMSHLPCSSCWGGSYVLASDGGVATCNECHGGRYAGNVGSPANGLTGGFIHGSSAPKNTGNDPQGYRFMNGADWAGHTLGDTAGQGGCYTLNGSDSYGNCTQHSGGANFSTNYFYPRPNQ